MPPLPSPLPVALLAGGLATRLRPVTEKIPKLLVEVAGEPFFSHQLRLLQAAGLTRVVLCVGHLGEQIVAHYGDGAKWGMQLEYVFDGPRLLGTGGALIQALPKLGDAFYVLYGDSYLPVDYQAVGDAFQRSGRLGLMTVYENRGRYEVSNVEFAAGEIKRYDKRRVSGRCLRRLRARRRRRPRRGPAGPGRPAPARWLRGERALLRNRLPRRTGRAGCVAAEEGRVKVRVKESEGMRD